MCPTATIPEATTAAPAATETGDPYGFFSWLNAVLSGLLGLPASVEPTRTSQVGPLRTTTTRQLAAWATFVMGPAPVRQNAAFRCIRKHAGQSR